MEIIFSRDHSKESTKLKAGCFIRFHAILEEGEYEIFCRNHDMFAGPTVQLRITVYKCNAEGKKMENIAIVERTIDRIGSQITFYENNSCLEKIVIENLSLLEVELLNNGTFGREVKTSIEVRGKSKNHKVLMEKQFNNRKEFEDMIKNLKDEEEQNNIFVVEKYDQTIPLKASICRIIPKDVDVFSKTLSSNQYGNTIVSASVKKSFLFHGPPGTGKTYLATSIAKFVGGHFIKTSGSSFTNSKRVIDLFTKADNLLKHHPDLPVVIFIDEFDGVGTKRDKSEKEHYSTVTELLSRMDSFSKRDNLVFMGATNLINDIDAAFKNNNERFTLIPIDHPTDQERLELLKYFTKQKSLHHDVNLQHFAKITSKQNVAFLKELVDRAATVAIDRKSDKINHVHFKTSYDSLIASLD